MTWVALGQALPEAIGIAISPVPIVLVILMLVSTRARVNGLAFMAGWMAGVLVVAGAAFLLADAADAATDPEAADGVAVSKLVFGDRSADVLASWKTWLVANTATVMMVLFAVLGAKMIGDGLGLLS